ncbi:MAG: MBL fold metallo-hydrolase [Candidatus Moduliflexus flocculans]|nr:MBL fold metallo-hydrolase [Candidatus Moduliflexus flocculans]
MTLRRRVPEAPAMDAGADLPGLSFVLLSHEHSDHFDLELIRQLRGLPVTWVVPEFLLERLRPACLPAERVLRPAAAAAAGLLRHAHHALRRPAPGSRSQPPGRAAASRRTATWPNGRAGAGSSRRHPHL